MHSITFRIQGGGDVSISAASGENILRLASRAGLDIDAPCGGNGNCGKCRIRVTAGTVQSETSRYITDAEHDSGWLLACGSTVVGEAVFEVPADAVSFKKGIQTADLSTLEERERYHNAITGIFGVGFLRGCEETGHGVAVDIGTTTVTAALLSLGTGELCSKASMGNGQIRYGADIINRIIAGSRPGGREALRSAIMESSIIPLITELCTVAGIEPSEITRCVVAGNTTMEHLFLGEDAESIRLEPYEPAFLEKTGVTAEMAKLPFLAGSPVILAPNVGSYVGGDITAGTFASMIWSMDGLRLFVDLGTNGELVLGNREFLLCCACSAGPAFEGGDISCGMRATAGAIESVKIDMTTMEPTLNVIGGGKPSGVCGSGLIDLVAELFRCGIIDASGKFTKSGQRIRRDDYSASYVAAFTHESSSGRDVALSDADIACFIRAKAAIFSAIKVMLDSLDMTADCLDRVIIAGGIGSGISIENAISIGMLPAIPEEKYNYAGNTSLTGACAMLLSDEVTQKVFELGRSMTYIELSTHPGYMDEFIAASFLPHTNANYFSLASEG